MTTVTGPLRDKDQATTTAAKNAETVELLREGLIKAQRERIKELHEEIGELFDEVSALKMQLKEVDADAVALAAENAALRAVALAAEWYEDSGFEYCPICGSSDNVGHCTQCPYTKARAAGYLPEEVRP